MKIRNLIGLAGVSMRENRTAKLWGKRFEACMILVAIWLPLQWYLGLKQEISYSILHIADWVVWLFFLSETVVLASLVDNKLRYLLKNWLNWLIIMGGLVLVVGWFSQESRTPIFASLRLLQLFLMMRLLLPSWDSLVDILSRNQLGTTLFVFCIITLLAGVLMSLVDPNIHSPWDGIWWAWETVTTVGYGDQIPTTVFGRIMAIILMIMGVALISLLTANFSAYFLGKRNSALKKGEDELLRITTAIKSDEAELLRLTHAIKDEEDEMLQLMREIKLQMNSMEQRLGNLETQHTKSGQ